MTLLFILDTVEYPLAPTPALARRVACLLAQKGHSVHLLELWDGQTPPPAAPGCTQHPLAFADERQMNQALEFGQAGGSPVPLRLARLAAHPAAALAAVRQILLKRPRRQSAARRAIQRLHGQYSFDAAIAVAAPYAGSFALAAAINCKKISWQMDPYAANQSYRAPGAWQTERRLLAALDYVLAPPALAPYYAADGPLAGFAHKMQTLDFASLTPPPPVPGAGAAVSASGRRRCVFVGSLYPQLRTPHFALQLFSALNDPGWELVFVGGGWQHYPPDLLQPYRAALGERLVVTGPLDKAQADACLAGADVLLSLGNGVDNQVPSKLFEYFAAGKPILHLAKLACDPCLAYLDRWPLALCLQESEGLAPAVLARLAGFLQQKGGQRLPFAAARSLFYQNTPEYAAQRIEALLAAPRPG